MIALAHGPSLALALTAPLFAVAVMAVALLTPRRTK